MARQKLRRHGSVVNVVALAINTREVAPSPSIGLPPLCEIEEQDGGTTTVRGWPIVVVNPRKAMQKGSELSR
jgi:hypothetical protein